MFIQVKLLNGLAEPLWYAVPAEYHKLSLSGLIVQVPLRNKIVPAIVIAEYTTKPFNLTFKLKDIHRLEPLPADAHYLPFLKKLSTYQQVDCLHFIKRIHQFLANKKDENCIPQDKKADTHLSDIILTDEQQKVSDFITPLIDKNVYTPIVLHGITGSGKTEVYKKIFLDALNKHKTSLLLLPEVTLAIAFENRLKQELPNMPIYGFHSGKSPKEKKKIWNNLSFQTPMILIGVHLPVLLPIANLGLIVVDEEHDVGYQEKKHPKINSKDAALIRAQQIKIPIILGSATPSISSLYNVKTKKWHFFQLKKRFSGSLPSVQIVSLSENKNRKQFWISKELQNAIQDRLNKNEQTIIFINRRGYSFFVQCKNCSFIFSCTSCSVSLTMHENDQLVCHYCSNSVALPHECAQCHSPSDEFIKKGIGTQKVVSILQKTFPQARIARADLDTTTKKKVWQQTIADMAQGNIDIMVGTQTITKGFHFPKVTLVGVLWADLHIGFPIYNSAETALQQLIQVAGRAGRNQADSTVIIQTMAQHELFNHLNEIDYLQFYAHEMEIRQELSYPPAQRLAELEIKHVNEKKLEIDANNLMSHLHAYAQKTALPVIILGPTKPPVSKIKEIHSRKIYIKGKDFTFIAQLYQQINHKHYSSSIYFTPNPLA